MIARRVGKVVVATAIAVGALPVNSGLSAGNTVPGSNAARYQVAITANRLKPAGCAGITLTTLAVGVSGTSGADLLLGSAAANAMIGRAGDDCILAGGGNDSINCGGGTDVAIGGPGTDTFSANCETQIQ